MDFEKSKIGIKNQFRNVVIDIQKLLNSTCNLDKSNIILSYNEISLINLKKEYEFKSEYYIILSEIVDNIQIDSIKDELEQLNFDDN